MATTQPGAPANPAYTATVGRQGSGPPLAQFAPTSPALGISQNDPTRGGAYVQSVDPNSLQSYQLEQLSATNSPLMQQAALRAQANAAARGGGVSGTQAIDASNRGMFDILAPIAGADAGRYGDVGDLNEQELNQNQANRLNNQTSIQTATIGAGASRAATSERQHEFDTTQGNRAQDREWAVADQNTAARASIRSQTFQTFLTAIASDPAYWGDPQGAMGLLSTYGTDIDAMMRQQFPEYYATDQNGDPVGGGT